MKLYVEKLPKNCEDCPFAKNKWYCGILDCTINYALSITKKGIRKDCPLQTIKNHDNELIDKIIHDVVVNNTDDGYISNSVDFNNLIEYLQSLKKEN